MLKSLKQSLPNRRGASDSKCTWAIAHVENLERERRDREAAAGPPPMQLLGIALEQARIGSRSCLRVRKTTATPATPPSSSVKRVHFPGDESIATYQYIPTRSELRRRALEEDGRDCEAKPEPNNDSSGPGNGTENLEDPNSSTDGSDSGDGAGTPEDSDSNSSKDGSEPGNGADQPEDLSGILDLTDAYELLLSQRLQKAQIYANVLTKRAIREGAMDFALYVSRSSRHLSWLENSVQQFCPSALIGSYQGEARHQAKFGGHAITLVGELMYADFKSAMSGQRCLRVPPATGVSQVQWSKPPAEK